MYNKNLKDIRIDHDLTQSQLANILKISRQYYCRYENGEVDIPIRHLTTLAKYYNVSIDYLAGLISTPIALYRNDQLNNINIPTNIDNNKIINSYNAAPENIKKAIRNLLNI